MNRVLRFFLQRLDVQNAVDALQSVLDDHGVLAGKHDLCQRDGNDRSDDDIEDQVDQKRIGHAALRKVQASADQKGKHAVDRRGVSHHRHAKLLCVRDDPLAVIVDRGLEALKRKHRLPKGFHHRDSAHIFHRFVRHIIQRVLVFLHLLLHLFAGHFDHDQESENHRNNAQQTKPPVKEEEKPQQADRRGDGARLIRQLMRQICFGGGAGFVDDLSHFAAAEAVHKPERQRNDMVHGLTADIGRDAKRGNMGAHQTAYIHKQRQRRKQHRHPPVVRKILRQRKVRGDLQHLFDDHPDVHKRHQCHQCAGRR